MKNKRLRSVLTIGVILSTTLLAKESTASDKYTNNYDLAKTSVEKHRGRMPSDKSIRAIAEYEDIIEYFSSLSYARVGYNVNPIYIKALIAAESDGNPNAVSPRKTRGLTQVLYETGKEWARELAHSGYSFKYIDEGRLRNLQPGDLFDPAINILLCCYATDLYNARFGDQLATTVGAWNAGPGAVIRHNGCPPFTETIDLVGFVDAYMIYFMKNPYAP